MTTAYLINHYPSSILSSCIPFKALFHQKLVISLFCSSSTKRNISNFLPNPPFDFLRYRIKHKGFRCFNPKTNCLHIFRYVTFLKHIRFYSLLVASHSPDPPHSYPLHPFLDLFPKSSPCPLFILLFVFISIMLVNRPLCRLNYYLPLLHDWWTPHRYPLQLHRPVDHYGLWLLTIFPQPTNSFLQLSILILSLSHTNKHPPIHTGRLLQPKNLRLCTRLIHEILFLLLSIIMLLVANGYIKIRT